MADCRVKLFVSTMVRRGRFPPSIRRIVDGSVAYPHPISSPQSALLVVGPSTPPPARTRCSVRWLAEPLFPSLDPSDRRRARYYAPPHQTAYVLPPRQGAVLLHRCRLFASLLLSCLPAYRLRGLTSWRSGSVLLFVDLGVRVETTARSSPSPLFHPTFS